MPSTNNNNKRRRSARESSRPKAFLEEVEVEDGVIDWKVDGQCGIDNQPGGIKRTKKEQQEKQKRDKGLKKCDILVDEHGWKLKKRASSPDYWVIVAPGVTKKKDEIPHVNMFPSYVALYEQYQKDGRTLKRIIARGAAASAEKEPPHCELSFKARLERIEKYLTGNPKTNGQLPFLLHIEKREDSCEYKAPPGATIPDRLEKLESKIGLS